ncbi:serine/threonine protein kinase [Bifidobacterium sp. DSM 109958]|uniref:Serine/threonine protein kinase n=1 Tax=Bifidobacterium moraviense TaxID=2675323 RepID=A0A7Y0F2V6_9BIFI|nr:PASTA domain-containing protein [Bifidobacterium sp. DSM 109958]NMN00988.1 serine/threonine protein kinase [Bifidobacterium sp. DSM 109958]
MFCIHCGTKNEDGGKFCVGCGAPLQADEPAATAPAATAAPAAPATPVATPAPVAQPTPTASVAQPDAVPVAQTPAPTPAPEPMPAVQQPADQPVDAAPVAQPAAPAPAPSPEPAPVAETPAPAPVTPDVAVAANVAAATATKPHRGWVKPVVITLVVALIAGGCGLGAFLTWRAGIWGGKIVPNPSDFQPAAGQALTADVVAKQLNDKGIATQIKQVYSAKPKGEYAGLEGMQPGDRVQKDQTVTVKSSLGPGVPEGTVGKTAADAQAVLKDMGVPVTAKKVVVADDSTTPEGSVVVTSPADGQPLPDDQKTDGIFIGVATKGDGIPFDVLGKDVDTVKSELESKGFTVNVADRLARKDYIGKVSGADPAPGTAVSGSKTVTLYRGIGGDDAKSALDVQDFYGTNTWGSPYTLAGRYCNKSGSCLAFESSTANAQAEKPFLYQTEGSTSPYKDQNYNGESGTMMVACDAAQQPFCSSQNADYLINGSTGAFELFPQADLMGYMCGSTPESSDAIGMLCVNGQMQSVSDYSMQASGATYQMDDFYLVVPVGADLDQLKSNGYFDDAALKAADGKPAVDTTRPFIVARDKSQYDSTSVNYDPINGSNPFLPYTGWGPDNTVKMKPAPTDDDVYYLVDNADMDWKSLPAAN